MSAEQERAAVVAIPEITVPLNDWLALHRRVGFAEGLLTGWFYSDPQNNGRCKDATRDFLWGGADRDHLARHDQGGAA